jgi:hypothetical protein
MLKQRINENAIKYNNLSNIDKRNIFAIRVKMIQIPNNFPMGKEEIKCICGEKEEMSHIYYCENLSENKKVSGRYENIYEDNVLKQVEVYKQFENNLKTREKFINEGEILNQRK